MRLKFFLTSMLLGVISVYSLASVAQTINSSYFATHLECRFQFGASLVWQWTVDSKKYDTLVYPTAKGRALPKVSTRHLAPDLSIRIRQEDLNLMSGTTSIEVFNPKNPYSSICLNTVQLERKYRLSYEDFDREIANTIKIECGELNGSCIQKYKPLPLHKPLPLKEKPSIARKSLVLSTIYQISKFMGENGRHKGL